MNEWNTQFDMKSNVKFKRKIELKWQLNVISNKVVDQSKELQE